MTVTDEQFAAAFGAYCATPECGTRAKEGRAMLAALEAHGCIEKPGLSVRQELVAQLMCSDNQYSVERAAEVADMILALGDPK
jgi:hypothetical protein